MDPGHFRVGQVCPMTEKGEVARNKVTVTEMLRDSETRNNSFAGME